MTASELALLERLVSARFGRDATRRDPVPWGSVAVGAPAVAAPSALVDIWDESPRERLRHARGRSYSDMVALQAGDYGTPPDAVVFPRHSTDVAAVLDWAADEAVTVIPFGGGTSVVGGVTPPHDGGRVVSLDMSSMAALLDVDAVSEAAHIQAGAAGPVIATLLADHDLTLRFFPQSYELSTLGGWIATRAAGHFATGATHIDDMVEAVGAVTPAGRWESLRVPASGAGPSPDRLLLGSEGVLGVITDAWVRVQRPPRFRASATVSFPDLLRAASAVQAVVQSGLRPANCRILDQAEALLAGAGDGTAALVLLAFESPGAPVDELLTAAVELCRDAGGASPDSTTARNGEGAAQDAATQWRSTFLRAPYLRDALVSMGMVSETFETAVTWHALDGLLASVTEATTRAVTDVCGDGIVTCRITHAYPDGAAPYFTVIAPAAQGGEARQWAEIKAAASEALVAAGGTITHHHAVGRDHRPWYDRQRPDAFATALSAAKAALDPAGVLNPGVLL